MEVAAKKVLKVYSLLHLNRQDTTDDIRKDQSDEPV